MKLKQINITFACGHSTRGVLPAHTALIKLVQNYAKVSCVCPECLPPVKAKRKPGRPRGAIPPD